MRSERSSNRQYTYLLSTSREICNSKTRGMRRVNQKFACHRRVAALCRILVEDVRAGFVYMNFTLGSFVFVIYPSLHVSRQVFWTRVPTVATHPLHFEWSPCADRWNP